MFYAVSSATGPGKSGHDVWWRVGPNFKKPAKNKIFLKIVKSTGHTVVIKFCFINGLNIQPKFPVLGREWTCSHLFKILKPTMFCQYTQNPNKTWRNFGLILLILSWPIIWNIPNFINLTIFFFRILCPTKLLKNGGVIEWIVVWPTFPIWYLQIISKKVVGGLKKLKLSKWPSSTSNICKNCCPRVRIKAAAAETEVDTAVSNFCKKIAKSHLRHFSVKLQYEVCRFSHLTFFFRIAAHGFE